MLKFPEKNIDLTDLNRTFPGFNIPKWQRMFDSAYEWHTLALDLENAMRTEPGAVMYHKIKIYGIGMALEMFVKVWVLYNDDKFKPTAPKYRHKTTNILEDYRTLGKFKDILDNELLLDDIRMLENVLNTKYGDTIVYERKSDHLYILLNELQEMISKTTKRGYSSKHING